MDLVVIIVIIDEIC